MQSFLSRAEEVMELLCNYGTDRGCPGQTVSSTGLKSYKTKKTIGSFVELCYDFLTSFPERIPGFI